MEPNPASRVHRLLARPWLLAFVPINAATSGLGVALPLLILIPLHGTWAEIAVAASLFNGVVIVASMFWGWVSDHYPSRRKLLVLNFAGFGILYLGLGLIRSPSEIPALFVLYAAIGGIAPAGSSASNLLILEKFGPAERPSAFASFQLMSILGAMGGLLAGVAWLDLDLALSPFLDLLALLAFGSVAAVWIGVRDSDRPATTAHVARDAAGLVSRLYHLATWRNSIPFFPTRPDLSRAGWARLRRWAREEAHHELPLILAASFLFNLTANLFNISYTPYLYAIGIGASSIFLVNLANNAAQGLVYPWSGRLTGTTGADRLVREASYARSLGYLAVGGFTFVPLVVGAAFAANVLAYAVLGAAIALYSTASSIILFRALDGRDAGTLLGVNSALGGIAAVAGASLSGILALVGSFRLVFLISAGGLLASLPLWAGAAEANRARRRREAEAARSELPSAGAKTG